MVVEGGKPDYRRVMSAVDDILTNNYVIEPPTPIQSIVRNYGLDILETSFPEEYRNICGYIDISGKSVILNSADNANRKAFTLAHELGHWILHNNILETQPEYSILYRTAIGQVINHIETEANFFAANLLVPMKLLRQYQNHDIEFLSDLFGVSTDVIGYRLENKRS